MYSETVEFGTQARLKHIWGHIIPQVSVHMYMYVCTLALA